MRYIPKVYYHKNILKLVFSLIEEGYRSYSELPETDKELLSAECINALGNDAYNCIIDSDDFDIVLHHFKNFLKSGNSDFAKDMAVTMAKNAMDYFEQYMNDLFEEKINENQWDINFDAGLKPITDKSTGETLWL